MLCVLVLERAKPVASADVLHPTHPVESNGAEGDRFPHHYQPLPCPCYGSVEELYSTVCAWVNMYVHVHVNACVCAHVRTCTCMNMCVYMRLERERDRERGERERERERGERKGGFIVSLTVYLLPPSLPPSLPFFFLSNKQNKDLTRQNSQNSHLLLYPSLWLLVPGQSSQFLHYILYATCF